jgi:hypothetical protein
MELSPTAQEVLRKYKSRFEVKLSDTWDFPEEETRAVHELERQHDAKEHAEWAAERLVEMLRNSDRNPEYELTEPVRRELCCRTLVRGYLVQQSQLVHCLVKAMVLAVNASRDRRSRCAQCQVL